MNSEIFHLENNDPTSARHTMRMVFGYLRLLVRHKWIVLGMVVAAGFIGFVKFKRTPEQYQASASMMIRSAGASNRREAIVAMNMMLAGYKQMLLSDGVLNDTIRELEHRDQLPPNLAGADELRKPLILRSMLFVDFDNKDNIVRVSCKSGRPDVTVNVIRALTDASEEFMRSDQQSMNTAMENRLSRERDRVLETLTNLRERLLQLRKESGDISSLDGSDEPHPAVRRVTTLSEQLTVLRNRKLELAASYQALMKLAKNTGDLTPILPVMEEVLGHDAVYNYPGVADHSLEQIEDLQQQLRELETDLSSRTDFLGARHPEIQRRLAERHSLQQQVVTLQQEQTRRSEHGLYDPAIANWMLETIFAEHDRVDRKLLLLQQEFQSAQEEALALNDKLAEIQMLRQQIDTQQTEHSSLMARLGAIAPEEFQETLRVKRLTDPLLPRSPIAPVLSRVMSISLVLGFMAALLVVYVIDLVDDRLRSAEEVQLQLAMPVLGTIRPLPDDDLGDARIYVHAKPLSVQTECFRTIRTAISLSESETRCLAITSSEQSEGKTTLTSNLAATFAQTGSRTLLIDADMRRPGLSKLLDIRGNGGLSEILRANDNVPEMCRERVVETEVPGLHVLPCGPRMMNAGVLLSMPSLSAILDWAVSQYDQVLVDCPPTLPVSDASIVGNYVDGMLFLLNPEKTHRRSALRAVDQLRSVGMNLVGVITNTSSETHAGAYGYGYGYGYGKEYTYGHDEQDETHDPLFTEEDFVPSAVDDDEPPRYSLLSDSARRADSNPPEKAA